MYFTRNHLIMVYQSRLFSCGLGVGFRMMWIRNICVCYITISKTEIKERICDPDISISQVTDIIERKGGVISCIIYMPVHKPNDDLCSGWLIGEGYEDFHDLISTTDSYPKW